MDEREQNKAVVRRFVTEIFQELKPAAVDVSGGVESAPGCKDAEKIRRFIAAVRAADASGGSG